jgi:hypothetical protein
MKHHTTLLVAFTAVVVAGTVLWVNAGSLTPPAGPVAPTMRTLDQISADIASLQAPVKRVVRGVITFDKDGAPELSQAFAPPIDPSKSVVSLSDAVAMDCNLTPAPVIARHGACLISLTATQITVRVDNNIPITGAKVSYQIVEYN